MAKDNRFVSLAVVVLIGVVLQGAFIFVDHQETPSKTAVAFSKAYFQLDPAMADSLSAEILENGDVVSSYIEKVADDARARGFALKRMISQLSLDETHTVFKDDNTAEVRITGCRRVTINPIFGFVAKLFNLNQAHPVDETLILVREDGQWKVSGQPFDLIRTM